MSKIFAWFSKNPFIAGMITMLLIVILTAGTLFIYHSCNKPIPVPQPFQIDTSQNYTYNQKIKLFTIIVNNKDSAISILREAIKQLNKQVIRKYPATKIKNLDSLRNALQDSSNCLSQQRLENSALFEGLYQCDTARAARDSIRKQQALKIGNLTSNLNKIIVSDSIKAIEVKNSVIKPTFWQKAKTDCLLLLGGFLSGVIVSKL
jgi:hypothetical protein